ncbi:MAG: YncE family protein, partial [Bacteroidota bacterium]
MLILAGFILLLQACMDDDALWETQPVPLVPAPKGVFIINEGNFMYGNASLSYYDPQQMQVANDVFFHTNALPLGDVAVSMTIKDNLGYIVVNNSGRIYIIDLETFKLKGQITGLTSPRFMHFVSDEKAYVTDLYAKAIAIVNPQTFQITGTIDVSNPQSDFYQHSTEQMVQVGKYVFINCWSYDKHILVIDTETDEWVDTIEVPLQPQSMVVDASDKIWLISDGGFAGSPFGHEPPALFKIDPQSREIVKTYHFQPGDHALSLAINKTRDTLYFINRHLYRHPAASADFPEVLIESPYSADTFGGYRSVGVDPASSEIYVGDAIDFVQPGIVYRFSPQGEP